MLYTIFGYFIVAYFLRFPEKKSWKFAAPLFFLSFFISIVAEIPNPFLLMPFFVEFFYMRRIDSNSLSPFKRGFYFLVAAIASMLAFIVCILAFIWYEKYFKSIDGDALGFGILNLVMVVGPASFALSVAFAFLWIIFVPMFEARKVIPIQIVHDNSMDASRGFLGGTKEVVSVITAFFIPLFVFSGLGMFWLEPIDNMLGLYEGRGIVVLMLMEIFSLLVSAYIARKVYRMFEKKFEQQHLTRQ